MDLPKNEYGDQIKNGYTIDYKTIKYVTTRKTEGNYLVFQYRKCSVRILDPACLNPQEEIVTENISETPNTQQDFASDNNTQSETKTKVQETETVVDEECWEYVTKKQRRLVTETYNTGEYYAGIGDFSGSPGNRMASQVRTRSYWETQNVTVKQPCGTTVEEDLPIASDEEFEEAKVAVRERRPVYIFLNGSFSFSKAGNFSSGGGGGGTVQQTGKPSFPTTKGKPSFPTTKGKPSFPTTRGR